MAKKKFTQLPPADPFTGAEIFAIVQEGQSRQATSEQVVAFASGIGISLWDFSAEGGYPTDPNKLYIVTDNSVLPENTWMVAISPTPSGSGDFYFK